MNEPSGTQKLCSKTSWPYCLLKNEIKLKLAPKIPLAIRIVYATTYLNKHNIRSKMCRLCLQLLKIQSFYSVPFEASFTSGVHLKCCLDRQVNSFWNGAEFLSIRLSRSVWMKASSVKELHIFSAFVLKIKTKAGGWVEVDQQEIESPQQL